MTILRWLLCHLLLIIVLVSLSLAYVFRDSLKEDFNRMTGKINQLEKNQTSAAENSKSNQNNSNIRSSISSSKDVLNKNIPVAKDKEFGDFQQSPFSKTETAQLAGREKIGAGLDDSSGTVQKAADPWAQMLPSKTETNKSHDAADKKVSSAIVSSFPPDDYIPEEDGSESGYSDKKNISERSTPLTAVSPTNRAIDHEQRQPGMLTDDTASNKSSKYQAALAKVRQLYWNGKTGPAQDIYEKLMFDYPQQPEAAAELGNIFLQQGNRKAASWAYQNAIPRYLNLHREQEAINLMRFISQYDPAIAESLQKKYW